MKVSVITSLYNCLPYIHGYFKALSKIYDIENTEVLLLHNAPSDEEIAAIQQYEGQVPNLRHIIIPERESLYATWNRGIRLAKGEYLAVWNVDDIRYPDSITKQAKALDTNPDAAMSYGDIVETSTYGADKGKFREHPVYHGNENEFLRSHMIGCFPMWRKGIHEKAGYFDEQFRIVADFEFQVRVARSFKFVKVEGVLGEYLGSGDSGNNKISSSQKLDIERTAVELRYAQFDKINYLFAITALRNFDIGHIYHCEKKAALENFFPSYRNFVLSRLHLILPGLAKLPINTARYLKKFFR